MIKKLMTALAILLAGALTLGLTACGSNSSGGTTTPSASYSSSSWSDVTVASGDQQVTLRWTDNNITTSSSSSTTITYNIYYSSSPGVKKNGTGVSKIANVTSPYVHTGLPNGTTYYYVITEVSPTGVEGVESKEVSATPQASLPAAPTGITVTADDGMVTLKWPAVTSTGTGTGLKYNIYWSTTAGVTKTTGTKISNVTASIVTAPFTFTHKALANDGATTYYYVITAETTAGESAVSKQVSAIPLKTQLAVNYSSGPPLVNSKYGSPTLVNATAGNQQVTIGWTAPGTPATYNPGTVGPLTYNITWWTDPANKQTIRNLSSTSFTHLSLTNGTTYYYIVTAVQTITNGSTVTTIGTDSAQVSVVPEATTPAGPAGLSAATGNQQVSLSWGKDKSGTTVTYNVYWSTDPSVITDTSVVLTKWTKISSITTNSFVHSGLKSGTTYYYMVTAQIDGESGYSNRISATP